MLQHMHAGLVSCWLPAQSLAVDGDVAEATVAADEMAQRARQVRAEIDWKT